jgi:predicted transcriptional regulator
VSKITLGELARRKGRSVSTLCINVKRLVAKGLLETQIDGRRLLIDEAAYDAARAAVENPGYAGRSEAKKAAHARRKAGKAAKATETDRLSNLSTAQRPPVGTPTPIGPNYAVERTKREAYQAENARLDLEERLGRLADVAEVEANTFDVMRRIRDRFLGMSSAVAGRCAAAPDERSIRAILDVEIRAILAAMSEEFDRKAGKTLENAA